MAGVSCAAVDDLPGKAASLWMETAPPISFPTADPNLSVDVAILGAGICGITAAVLLKRAGLRVALIEADRVAAGVSGYTTAKVTSNHGLLYHSLRSNHGAEGARVYAEANQAGLERIASFVEEGSIECDFRRRPAITYTEGRDEVGQVEAEVEAAREAGLPVSFVDTAPDLPYPIAGGISYAEQAEFHVRRYLLPLAREVPGDGSYVAEGVRALGVSEGSPCAVRTDRGTVTADHVLVATHYPFLDRGLFFARLSAERSYILAAEIEGDPPAGMYLSTESPAHSIRSQPEAGRELVLIGGESHKAGQADEAERYRRLEEWARGRFDVRAFQYRWSTQDAMPADGIPYVGPVTPRSKRVLTATGFRKWGLTNGTAAAMMLADRVLGLDNPWQETFDSNRLTPLASAKKLVKENVNVGMHFVGDRIRRHNPPGPESLAPGEGAIVSAGGGKVAAYRDDGGALHGVSPVCTHLWCLVEWNTAERSWDCPCHGSRFDVEGRVIQGPAVKDLEAKPLGEG